MGVIELKADVFSNPKKGKKVFGALVRILEAQQAQLETLADERKRQEERIKIEYERWISGVRSLKDLIDQVYILSHSIFYLGLRFLSLIWVCYPFPVEEANQIVWNGTSCWSC